MSQFWIVEKKKVDFDRDGYRDDDIQMRFCFFGTEKEVKEYVDSQNNLLLTEYCKSVNREIAGLKKELKKLNAIDKSTIPDHLFVVHESKLYSLEFDIQRLTSTTQFEKYKNIEGSLYYDYSSINDELEPINFDWENVRVHS